MRLKMLNHLAAFGGSFGHGISVDEHARIARNARPGDVIVTRTKRRLWNCLIPGFWSHAAMYVGDGDVVDAISSGVTRRELVELSGCVDYAALLRPTFTGHKRRSLAATIMTDYVGTPYDYGFLPGDGALYCSEAIWKAYKEACGDWFQMELRSRLGISTVTPQDFANSRYFEVI